MKFITWNDKATYKVAFLIKEQAFQKQEIAENYCFNLEDTICFSIPNHKVVKEERTNLLTTIDKILNYYSVEIVVVADGELFKKLAKTSKAEPYYGTVVNNGRKIILTVNHQALIYSPKMKDKLDLSMQALTKELNEEDSSLGKGIIHSAIYLTDNTEVSQRLSELHQHDSLAVDIETTSLFLKEARIVSIAFSWDVHNGIAMMVDEGTIPLLKNFFEQYMGRTIYHNASFDITHLISSLFMDSWTDYEGLVHGLHVMFRSVDDTKLIAYVSTNSTEGNELSLKALALGYTGNYALLEDEKDITKFSTDEILKYNLVDTLATNWVYEKYYPVMVEENQLDVYRNILIPSLKPIVQMQLVGMPMDMQHILEADKEFNSIYNKYYKELRSSRYVKDLEWELQKEAFIIKNKELVKKYIPIDQFNTPININSNVHVGKLLYEQLGFEVVNTTKKGNPSVDGDTLNMYYQQLLTQYGISEEEL